MTDTKITRGVVSGAVSGAIGGALGGGGGSQPKVVIVKSVGVVKSIKDVASIKDVKQISRVKDVSVKAFPCPRVNDSGLASAWSLSDVIAMGISAWATLQTWNSSVEEYKIAKRYYNLAREQWKHFYANYRPLETQEINEVLGEAPHKANYSGAIRGHTHLVSPIFTRADQHRASLMQKYNVCPDVAEFTRIEITQSTTMGDSSNFARRYAEILAQELNDSRWARYVSTAGRGRGLLSTSTAMATKASAFISDYGQAMGGLASNAMKFAGYNQNRKETEYNPVRQRVDGRADVPDTFRGSGGASLAGGGIATAQTSATNSDGGVAWANSSETTAPYMQPGTDPAGVVNVNSNVGG